MSKNKQKVKHVGFELLVGFPFIRKAKNGQTISETKFMAVAHGLTRDQAHAVQAADYPGANYRIQGARANIEPTTGKVDLFADRTQRRAA